MAITIDAAGTYAASLPDVTVGTSWGHKTWMINERGFAWQRPFSKADIARYGDETPPAGEILAVRTDGLDGKDALLALELPGFFTIPHFNGYAGVLIQLKVARAADVRAAIDAAYRAMAAEPPKKKPKSKAKPRPKKRKR